MGSDKEERESFGIAAFKDDIDGTGEIKLFFFPANQTVCCFGFFSFLFFPLYVIGISWHTHTHTQNNSKNKRYPAQKHLTSRAGFCKEEEAGSTAPVEKKQLTTNAKATSVCCWRHQPGCSYLSASPLVCRTLFFRAMKRGKSLRAEEVVGVRAVDGSTNTPKGLSLPAPFRLRVLQLQMDSIFVFHIWRVKSIGHN